MSRVSIRKKDAGGAVSVDLISFDLVRVISDRCACRRAPMRGRAQGTGAGGLGMGASLVDLT